MGIKFLLNLHFIAFIFSAPQEDRLIENSWACKHMFFNILLNADDQNLMANKNLNIKSSQNVYFCDFTDKL